MVVQWAKKRKFSLLDGIKSCPFSCFTEWLGELMALTAVHWHEIVNLRSPLLTVFVSVGFERFKLSWGRRPRETDVVRIVSTQLRHPFDRSHLKMAGPHFSGCVLKGASKRLDTHIP